MEDKIILPNFLIVGAAKSGTTSLYYYLNEHPEIYMSPIKEPHFLIGIDFSNIDEKGGRYDKLNKVIYRLEDYLNLFKNVKEEKAIGEATVGYLFFYRETIPNIKKYLKDPKIVILLRDPVDRAFSHYMHHVRDGYETLYFEEALKMEEKRKNWWYGYQYTKLGFYYKQVKAYLDNFSNVRIYLFDDLKKDSLKVVQDIYRFLEVDDSFVPPSIGIKFNVTGIPKNKFLHEFLRKPNAIKSTLRPLARLVLPDEETRERFLRKLLQKNLKKPEMKPETRDYLKRLYKEDILKLQDLIKRDLSHWLK